MKTGVLYLLFKLKILDQNVCIFLSFSSIQLKVFSLSYYQLLQLYILLVQQDNFSLFASYHYFGRLFDQIRQFKAAILLYHSPLEHKHFIKLKKTIVLLGYQVDEAFCCTKGLYKMKN